MRAKPTTAEKLLWEKLRNKEFRKKTLSNAHKILFAGSQKEDLIATILRKFEA